VKVGVLTALGRMENPRVFIYVYDQVPLGWVLSVSGIFYMWKLIWYTYCTVVCRLIFILSVWASSLLLNWIELNWIVFYSVFCSLIVFTCYLSFFLPSTSSRTTLILHTRAVLTATFDRRKTTVSRLPRHSQSPVILLLSIITEQI